MHFLQKKIVLFCTFLLTFFFFYLSTKSTYFSQYVLLLTFTFFFRTFRSSGLLADCDMLYFLTGACYLHDSYTIFLYWFITFHILERNVSFLNHAQTWPQLLWYARQSCRTLKFRQLIHAKE